MTTRGSAGKPSDGMGWFSIRFFGLAVDIGAVSFLVLEIPIRVLEKSVLEFLAQVVEVRLSLPQNRVI